jgi:hypothetical protein
MTITIASDPILNFGLTAEAHFDKIQKELQTSKCSFSPYLLASHILCQPHVCMINLFFIDLYYINPISYGVTK